MEKVGRALVAVIPTRRLVAIVIALAPLWLVSDIAAAYALAAVTAVVILDMLLLPAKWQVTAQRILPSNVGLGDKERGEYRVRSTAPRTLGFALFDALPRVIESPEGEVDLGQGVPGFEGTRRGGRCAAELAEGCFGFAEGVVGGGVFDQVLELIGGHR